MNLYEPVFYSTVIRGNNKERLKELEKETQLNNHDFKKTVEILSLWADFISITSDEDLMVRERYLKMLIQRFGFSKIKLIKAKDKIDEFYNLLIMFNLGVEGAFETLCNDYLKFDPEKKFIKL